MISGGFIMKMRPFVGSFIGCILFLFMCHATTGGAYVGINIGISVPQSVVISSPPAVVSIPGTYAYFIPGISADIIFYHGYWYRPYEGRRFRADSYNGPWGHIAPAKVPGVLIHLPRDYRHIPPGHEGIPYGQLKKNWGKWEREKYWDKHSKKEMHEETKWKHKKK
jgi:hypothetical protein